MHRSAETKSARDSWGLDVSVRVTPLKRRALLPVWLCDCLVGALGLAALLALAVMGRWL